MKTQHNSIHQVAPCTEYGKEHSHIVLTPPYVNGENEALVFKILEQTVTALYVALDDAPGPILMLEKLHTEIDELLPFMELHPASSPEFCTIKILKMMNRLPALVRLKKISQIPDIVLIKNNEYCEEEMDTSTEKEPRFLSSDESLLLRECYEEAKDRAISSKKGGLSTIRNLKHNSEVAKEDQIDLLCNGLWGGDGRF